MARFISFANHVDHKSCPINGSDGMTLIEVLIAVLLFAVFSGIFLVVTEMMAGLLPSKPLNSNGDFSCDGPSLEVACINSAFDEILPDFFEKNSDIPNLAGQCRPPSDFFPPREEIGWPVAYDCIFIISASGVISDLASSDLKDGPSLYLAEARVSDPAARAFWQVPVQRLFCWPYYKCVDVVR